MLLEWMHMSDNGMQDFTSHTGCPYSRSISQFISHTGSSLKREQIHLAHGGYWLDAIAEFTSHMGCHPEQLVTKLGRFLSLLVGISGTFVLRFDFFSIPPLPIVVAVVVNLLHCDRGL